MGYFYNRYYKDIKEHWNWEEIKKDALSNVYENYEGNKIASCYLGSVMGLYPSGKYYMPWCTNQTVRDVIKDEAFSEALNNVADENGMYITSGEGDPCDVYLEMYVADDEVEQESIFDEE